MLRAVHISHVVCFRMIGYDERNQLPVHVSKSRLSGSRIWEHLVRRAVQNTTPAEGRPAG